MRKPVPGRPSKLSGAQLKLYTLIVGANPQQLQFEFSWWARDIVRELIRRKLGVALSAVSVGRLLWAMSGSATWTRQAVRWAVRVRSAAWAAVGSTRVEMPSLMTCRPATHTSRTARAPAHQTTLANS